MNVEVDVLGSPVLNSPCGLCGLKATLNFQLCESRGGRPNSGRKATLKCSISEFRSCVKVEVAVLGSPSLIVLTFSVDVKQH